MRNCLAGLGIILMTIATPSLAQRLSEAPPPAEVPPPSFDGRQYVDSRGCAYVRAGQGDAVLWVPRVVGPERELACGLRPSLSRRVATARPVVRAPMPARPVTAAEPARPARAVVANAPRPASGATGAYVPPTVPAGLRPQPYRAAQTVAVRSVGRVPRVTPANPVQVALPHDRAETTARPGAAAPPIVGEAGLRPTQAPLFGAPITGPTKIAVARGPSPVRIPDGYRPAWDDGRLNPLRGVQTFRGALQTAQVWTQDVPRRARTAATGAQTYRYRVVDPSNALRSKADLQGVGQRVVVRPGH